MQAPCLSCGATVCVLFGLLLVVHHKLRENIFPVKTKQCSYKEPFYGLISCRRPHCAAFEASSESSEPYVGEGSPTTRCLWSPLTNIRVLNTKHLPGIETFKWD